MYPVHHKKFIVADSICLSAFHMIYQNGMKSTKKKKKKVLLFGVKPFIFFNPFVWIIGN